MAIPDYQTCMLPVLSALADGETRRVRDLPPIIADEFALTDEERAQLLPSGRTPVIRSRVGWAKTYLAKAGLIDSPKRGLVRLSDRGRQVLAENPTRIDNDYLERFPEFVEFVTRSNTRAPKSTVATTASVQQSHAPLSSQTPEEVIEEAHQRLQSELEDELLTTILECSPEFFEQLVIDLLVAMGYGGDRREAARVGRSGDGGIDGIIKEDRLGLDLIYVQAKRWQGTVGRPEIQKFAGALQGRRARRGVFITTSSFTREATQYADDIEASIVLIDGPTLTGLMIDHSLGVSTVDRYEIKRLDGDYFEGE